MRAASTAREGKRERAALVDAGATRARDELRGAAEDGLGVVQYLDGQRKLRTRPTVPLDLRVTQRATAARGGRGGSESGAEGDRTPDLLAASQTLSQLSYGPVAASSSGETGATASGGGGDLDRGHVRPELLELVEAPRAPA